MTDKATSFVMDSEDLATQTRRVTPLANAYRKLGTRLGAPLNDEFHALILLASNDAATFDVSEDDFVAVARQQFILARGARRGTLAADLLRIDALTSGLTETKAENKRLREREELLARLLGVADLGQWRADWEAPIKRLALTSRREGAAAMRLAVLNACEEYAKGYEHDDPRRTAADAILDAIGRIPEEVAP